MSKILVAQYRTIDYLDIIQNAPKIKDKGFLQYYDNQVDYYLGNDFGLPPKRYFKQTFKIIRLNPFCKLRVFQNWLRGWEQGSEEVEADKNKKILRVYIQLGYIRNDTMRFEVIYSQIYPIKQEKGGTASILLNDNIIARDNILFVWNDKKRYWQIR